MGGGGYICTPSISPLIIMGRHRTDNRTHRTYSLDDRSVAALKRESERLGLSISGLLRLFAGKLEREELRL